MRSWWEHSIKRLCTQSASRCAKSLRKGRRGRIALFIVRGIYRPMAEHRGGAGGAGSGGRTMADDSWVARFHRALTAAALRTRHPARRAFGSVRAAVAICAFVVGIYDLVIRFHYQEGSIYPPEIRQLIYIAAYTAFAAWLSDVVLVFGVFQREEKGLHNIVCAVLALFTFCGPMPFIMIILTACSRHWLSILWEIPRLFLYPVHFLLLVCLLAELRGQISDASPACVGVHKSKEEEGNHLLKDEGKGINNGVAEAHQPLDISNIC